MDAQKAKKKITEIMPLKPVIARLCLQSLIASAAIRESKTLWCLVLTG